jgi:predicted Zn-dependent protease
MHSEAELAGVLAHEISHVLQKHHLKAIKQGARTGLMAEFAGQALKDRGGNPELLKLVSAGTELYTRGLDKNDEFEADRMGVVIAARGGYDPYGLPAVLQTLNGLNAQDTKLALLFKTHPSLADRLNLLENQMAGRFDAFDGLPDLSSRFMETMKSGN